MGAALSERDETAQAAGAAFALGGDLVVSRLSLGASRITGPDLWGEPANPAGARRLLRRAVELGVDLVDTADAYGPAVSERLVAEALFPYDGVVVATKGGLVTEGPCRWRVDGRPERPRAACEASLRRLRVDLYQLHMVDDAVPLEESVGALAALRAEGKVRHVGLCNVKAEQVAQAREVVDVVSVQKPLPPLRSGVRGRAQDLRARRAGLLAVVPDRRRRVGPGRRAPGGGGGPHARSGGRPPPERGPVRWCRGAVGAAAGPVSRRPVGPSGGGPARGRTPDALDGAAVPR